MKTYGSDRRREGGTRNPFDDLAPTHLYNLRPSTAHLLKSEQIPQKEIVVPSATFTVYEDPLGQKNPFSNKRTEMRPGQPRTATPVARPSYYPRISRRPVRSPRISRIVSNKTSSEDDMDSEDLGTDGSGTSPDCGGIGGSSSSWATVYTDTRTSSATPASSKPSASWRQANMVETSSSDSTEISSVEIAREATLQPRIPLFGAVELPCKDVSPTVEVSSLGDSEISLPMNLAEGNHRLNSTLLDDGFAKNIEDVMGTVNISPIFQEVTAGIQQVGYEDLGENECDGDINNFTSADKLGDRIKEQRILETTPGQKSQPRQPKAPLKNVRRTGLLETKIITETEKKSSVSRRKKLSPMYNQVPSEDRRILKKTSTPVRNARQLLSPPVFSIDISSVNDASYSGFMIHQSVEVNSEEIHVSLDTSPVRTTDPRQTIVKSVIRSPKKDRNVSTNSPLQDKQNKTPDVDVGRSGSKRTKTRSITQVRKKMKNLRKKSTIKARISTKSKDRLHKQKKRSEFSFDTDTSGDEKSNKELFLRPRKKVSVIRSESPAREETKRKRKPVVALSGDNSPIRTKSRINNVSKGSSSEQSSAPSSKKSVTWGSATRHEYNESSPVFCSATEKDHNRIPAQYHLCSIIALDPFWPVMTNQDEHRTPPPLTKRKRESEKPFELDILCREW